MIYRYVLEALGIGKRHQRLKNPYLKIGGGVGGGP